MPYSLPQHYSLSRDCFTRNRVYKFITNLSEEEVSRCIDKPEKRVSQVGTNHEILLMNNEERTPNDKS